MTAIHQPVNTSEKQRNAMETIAAAIDAKGVDLGFEVGSNKIVGRCIEIGVKPTRKTSIRKWYFIQVDVLDKTVGDIAREAADAFEMWAKRELRPEHAKAN